MGLPRCPLQVGWRGVRKCSGRCVGNWRGGQRISLANGVGRCLGGCVGNRCGGRWYPSARCRVARTQDCRRSRHGACTLRRPLGWTCCLGGWGRAYEEGAVGHQLEMMVSEVAFQLESEVGKLFLRLVHTHRATVVRYNSKSWMMAGVSSISPISLRLYLCTRNSKKCLRRTLYFCKLSLLMVCPTR